MAALENTATRSNMVDRADIWLAVVSAAVLAFMMLFVCIGVVLRYGFNAPIAGTNEVLEMASVTFVMLALPHCTRQDGHIRIDLIDPLLGPLGATFTELLYRVLGICLLWFLVQANLTRMLDAWEFSDTTNMIEIPIWPFYGLIAVGMGLYALILAVQSIVILMTQGRRND